MLASFRSWLACHLQASGAALNQLGQKPLSTLMTVLVIALSLALPGLFWTFSANLWRLTSHWQQGGKISLYLKADLSEEEQIACIKRVRLIRGVGQAELISANDGLNLLTQQEGLGDLMHYLSENPLPPMIEVLPAVAVNSPSQIEQLSQRLRAEAGVEQVKLDRQWIHRLHILLGFVTRLICILMILLAAVVVLVVANTLRLAIHHRYEEIQVLKLIGASDPFILRPFLYCGLWYGFAGAVLAVLLVNICILSLGVALNQLAFVYKLSYQFDTMPSGQAVILLFCASILGWLGARFSVKRQLALIEP